MDHEKKEREVFDEADSPPTLEGEHPPERKLDIPEAGTGTPLESDPLPEQGDTPAQAALTITVQSWATPIVGLTMLVVGLLAGYYGRPLVKQDQPAVAASPSPTQPSGASSSSSASENQPNPQDRAALMDAILSRVRHFRGDPNAPITLIEFSDFQ